MKPDLSTVERQLRRRISPRAHMLALICASSAFAFVSSYLMLRVGLTSMALRYPLAVALGYGAFLIFIGLWLRRYRLHRHEQESGSGADASLDVVELPIDALWRVGTRAGSEAHFGGGGGFGGGGASRSFGAAVESTASSSAKGDGDFDFDFDVGDGAWPLLVAAAVAAIALGAALYTLYIAPVLFAELLLDVAIAGGVYRRIHHHTEGSWFRTVVRRTVVPAVVIASLLGTAGFVLQRA